MPLIAGYPELEDELRLNLEGRNRDIASEPWGQMMYLSGGVIVDDVEPDAGDRLRDALDRILRASHDALRHHEGT